MNNYFDGFRRIHDKPCIDGKPSSNNSWIYTSYLKRVGLLPSMPNIMLDEINLCWSLKQRHSHKADPIISRDEILGMCYLKPFFVNELRKTWNFSPYPLPKFNLITLLKQLIDCIGEHRNYWQIKQYKMMGHVALMVPLNDRPFLLELINAPLPWYYKIIKWWDKRKNPSDRSSRAIWSFKYGLDNFKGIEEYFGFDDHPIVMHIRGIK